MCDEYYDERAKAFWRAMVGDHELEKVEEKEEIEPLNFPLKIELEKPKPKMLVR